MQRLYVAVIMVMVMCSTTAIQSFGQKYYVNISYSYTLTCGPSCGAPRVYFNGTPGSTALTFTSPPPATYSIAIDRVCDAGRRVCNAATGGGTMPSEYKGSASFSNAYGSGSFTYCYEPDMPSVGVTGGGASYTLSMPIWGFKYVWEVAQGAGAMQPLQTFDYGTTPQMSSSITVTPAMMAAIFGGTGYGQNYTFRVKITGCNERTSAVTTGYTFTEPAPAVSLVGTPTKATCYQSATGTATLSISNSAVNNFYINCYNRTTGQSFAVPDGTLNTGQVRNGNYTIRGLRAGLWDFQVVNDAAMAANTWLEDVEVTEPTQVTVSFSTPAHNGYYIKCSGGTGDVTAIGNGGEGGYKDFEWNTGGVTTATLSGVVANTYKVKLKDRNDCQSAETPVILSAPSVVSASATSPKPYGGYEVKCHNLANGSATASGAGGVGGYTYAWSNGGNTATISNLAPDTYSVTVKDANGCPAPASVLLKAPTPIAFTIDKVHGLSCKGDTTAKFEAKPVMTSIIGTPHYQWQSGETRATIWAKGAGTYTVTVSDDQGCSTSGSTTLADPPGYTVSLASGLDYNGRAIKCNGDLNGKLVSTVRDAANTVTTATGYEWFKNGNSFSDGSQTVQEGLGKGTYKLVISYGLQCKAETQYTLNEPDPVAVTTTATTTVIYHGQAISCYNATDGSVRATVTGGTGAYTYLWNTGGTTSLLTDLGAGTYSVDVKDINGCPGKGDITLINPPKVTASIADVSDYNGFGVSCTSSTDGTMTATGSGGTNVFTYSWSNGRNTAINSGLGGGAYTVTVSDNNGCAAQASQTLKVPALLEAQVDSYTDVACNGGRDGVIRLQAVGGAGTYEYSRNGVDWFPNPEFAGLPVGTYALSVRDNNGCSASAIQTLNQPTALGLVFQDIDPAFCADPRGGATASASGGVAGYTYSWTDAGGNVISADARLSNVLGGLYKVTVHDAHNCPIADSVGITSTDGAKADYTAVSALCHDSSDGSAALTITEGDGPFIIKWPDGQSTLQGTNLKGGSYTVLITDGHACTVVKQVTVPAPTPLTLNVQSSTQPTCNGDCDGSLTLQAGGGVGAYQYSWNAQTGVTQNNLCHGTYDVVLTDDNGCRLDQQVTLQEPEVLTVSMLSSVQATCTDGCDGRLEVVGEGGNSGYIYSWDGGIAGASRSDLCPGEYSVMVTDAKGCVGSNVLTLANTPPVAVDLGGGVTLCVGQTYTLNAGPGWNNVQWGGSTAVSGTTQQVTLKEPGTYWVEVLDTKGCVGRDTFLLETSYDLLQASFMIPKEAVVGDTVAMIDVSWPLPELVDWSFPLEMKQVSASDDVVFGQFNTPGSYNVGLTARLGECRDYVEKNIVIIEGGEDETGGRLGYEEYVKAFGVYANPNDGAFDVVVNLAEADDIMLSIWSGQTGSLVAKLAQKGNASYSVHVDLRPLSSGTYVLRLDHARGSSYLRFIVQ